MPTACPALSAMSSPPPARDTSLPEVKIVLLPSELHRTATRRGTDQAHRFCGASRRNRQPGRNRRLVDVHDPIKMSEFGQKRKLLLCRSQRGSALASAKSEALDAVR